MIRVVYRWKVRVGEEASFTAAWERATTKIRSDTRGARGSVLLQSREHPAEFVTIARWEGLEDWQAFWQGNCPSPMQPMHLLAELQSTEPFDEIQDHTV